MIYSFFLLRHSHQSRHIVYTHRKYQGKKIIDFPYVKMQLLSFTYTSKTQQQLTLSITCLRTITFSKQTLRSSCLSLFNWIFFCVSAKHRILYIFPSFFIPWMIPGDENSHIHSISSSLLLFWDVDIEYRSWKIIKASNRCSKKTCQGKGRNDSLSKFFFFIYMQNSNLNISKQHQVCMF